MALEMKGLAKLTEECGELIQVASKKMARMDSDDHWDGAGSLKRRLEEEIADVHAILYVVMKNFDLNEQFILRRAVDKQELFFKWDTISKEDEEEPVKLT